MANKKPKKQTKKTEFNAISPVKIGRPTDYNELLANRICDIISTSNKGLSSICMAEDMPHRSTIHRWLNENKTFKDIYARAKEDQADFLAEEILEIADHTDEDHTPFTGSNVVNRDRLRVDTRKFIMAKVKPKVWGDKIDVTTDGEKIAPIDYSEFIKKVKDA